MPDTYNVGAINSALQNLAREVYGTGRGSPNREQLYRERIVTEGVKREQEEIERDRRRAEDAVVNPMIEAFTSMYQPLVPTKMAPTGQSVPMPVARPTAEAMVVENEVGSPAYDAFIAETTRQYPSFASQPIIDPQALRSVIEGNVRTGLAKKDMSGVNSSIADTIATLITGANGITENDAFRGNALRGTSTPQNQSYTAEGADEVARRNHDYSVEKKNLEAENRLEIARGRNATTERGQDIASADRQRGQDITSADRRYGVDARSDNKLPPGIPKSPDEIAKFEQLSKLKIMERLGGDPKGEVSPEVVRRVTEEYAKILGNRAAGSPNTALEMAIDKALEGAETSKGGWFGGGKVNKVMPGQTPAAPQTPQTPQAPQTAAKPAMSRQELDRYRDQTLREIDARNEPPEVKAARRAKLEEIYQQQIRGAR